MMDIWSDCDILISNKEEEGVANLCLMTIDDEINNEIPSNVPWKDAGSSRKPLSLYLWALHLTTQVQHAHRSDMPW